MGPISPRLSSSIALILSFFLTTAPLARADLPKIDFDRLGVVAVGGAFAGIDFYSTNSTSSFDTSSSTLLSRQSNGTVTALASTNAGGSINAVCGIGTTLYIGGNFSYLSDTAYANVATYDTGSGQFSSLGGGLDGTVHAVYCDTAWSAVWFGGDFHGPVSVNASQYGGAVAVYNTTASAWSAPPFFGLRGDQATVHTIESSSGGDSIYFGGSFTTDYGAVIGNATNNPNVPFSAGATPFSSSLVPVPLTPAQVNANPTSELPQFAGIGNILCPVGPDGPNTTWFGGNNSLTQITVRTNQYTNARGVRLGNSFLPGHSTTSFRVTTIPNNEVLNLSYVDPSTRTPLSCTASCPLGVDPTVPYQDFLFPTSTTLTGVQITLLTWSNSSAGLHLLQLLSDGAFASAISTNNAKSCFATDQSSTYETGYWNVINAVTSIAGTTQTMLRANVAVGTNPREAPQLTWMPYVSNAGVYDVYVYVPGCQQFGDCAARTSVDITVTPGGSYSPVTTTISQANESDSQYLVYSGYVVPEAPLYTVDVKLALSANATGSGNNGTFSLIADRVQFELKSLNPDGSDNGLPTGGSNGFGFYEYNFVAGANSTAFGVGVNATYILPNATETSFDQLSTIFQTMLGANASSATVNAIASVSNGTIFIGGSFAAVNGSSNIVGFSNGTIIPFAGSGLNGTVTALAYANDTLFVGGSFSGVSVDGYMAPAMSNIGAYTVSSGLWSSLGGGLNGPVVSLAITDTQLLVGGNFSETYASTGAAFGTQSGGVATWDIASATWISGGGMLFGQATLVEPGGDVQYIAGTIGAFSGNSASGWSILSADSNGNPSFSSASTPLVDAYEGARIVPTTSSSKKSPANGGKRRRKLGARSATSNSSWMHVPRIFSSSSSSKQHSHPVARDDSSTLPSEPEAPAPAVLAVAFWTNQTISSQAVILGGNFSFTPTDSNDTSSLSTGVALYYSDQKSVEALQGTQVDGTVYALYVSENSLFVGGNFALGSSNSFGMYDLSSQSWQTGAGTLSALNGELIVRSITSPPSESNLVVIAGTFSGAAGTTCQGVCAYDTKEQAWNGLNNGLSGEASSIDYAKDGSHDVLIVGGVLSLADGTSANVAKYYFHNSTWAAVSSGLPGPVTAVSVNNDKDSDIFAAGRSSDDSSPFFVHWNGTSWNNIDNSLTGQSNVAQMAFVPTIDDHDDNDLISKDRMLMVSGSLASDSFNNVSAALFDGKTWYPYLTSITPTGSAGSMAGVYHSFNTFSFKSGSHLATGIVILISIAIAAGIVFLLVLIGVIWTLLSRDSSQADQKAYMEEDDDSTQEPSSLLEHINAATRSTIVGGAAAGAAGAAVAHHEGGSRDDHALSNEDAYAGVDDGWRRTETPAGAAAVGGEEGEVEGAGRPAYARYSFDGEGEGELPMRTGTQLAVLDDRDAAWWYVRDEQTGREGVVPAAYLY